ncbi:MAG: type II toxin-antitoxin system Phd/YefM family antitoxin [Armatimonadota bacterium]
MADVTVSELRADMSAAMNRVAFGKERIIVQRQGKALAALVPIEDIEALEACEDRLWVELAEERMAEPGEDVPWKQVKKNAGL